VYRFKTEPAPISHKAHNCARAWGLARGPFLSDAVLAPFSSFGYRPTMPADDKLTPADPREVVIALSLGLTAKPKFAQHQAAETMAKIVAERLAEHLDRSGFVVMRKSVPATGAGDNRGRRGFER